MHTRHTNRKRALLSVCACLCLAGCGGERHGAQTPQAAPRPHLHCYIGLDASQSARTHLGGYTLLSGQIAGRLNAETDRLSLFRLDDQVTEFSDRAADGSMQTTLTAITQNVAQISPGRGTFPARFWEEAATRAARSEDDAVLILFTDGDNDDQRAASAQAIRAAAARLARNPHVKAVILCGVERRNYAALQAEFASLGEQRLHLLNPQEMQIDTLADWLQQARTPVEHAPEFADALPTHR